MIACTVEEKEFEILQSPNFQDLQSFIYRRCCVPLKSWYDRKYKLQRAQEDFWYALVMEN